MDGAGALSQPASLKWQGFPSPYPLGHHEKLDKVGPEGVHRNVYRSDHTSIEDACDLHRCATHKALSHSFDSRVRVAPEPDEVTLIGLWNKK
jgi:hypothetical protein